MSEPRPQQLNRRLALLEALIRDVREDYGWVHGWANSRSRSGDSLGGKPTAGAVNDETGSIVISRDKASARRHLELASARVDEAIEELKSAKALVSGRIKQRDPMPVVPGPALVTRAERRESHAAQQRRLERGEGYGDG